MDSGEKIGYFKYEFKLFNNMDEDTSDYILSQMEKQSKKIRDLEEKIDELSMKVSSLTEELDKLKMES